MLFNKTTTSTASVLMFSLSSEETRRLLVTKFSAVHHVVPAGLPELGKPLLSVEIDPDYPQLIEEVRTIVAEVDPGALELHQPDLV